MTSTEFADMALSFPGTIEKLHFDKKAFKIEDRRIFATLHEESAAANLKLSLADQAVFCSFDKNSVYPVPNKWGQQGWTTFKLEKIPADLMFDALNTAYNEALKVKGKVVKTKA